MQTVTHPNIVVIKGIKIQVISSQPISDAEALVVARNFYATRKFTKKDQAVTFEVFYRNDL